MSYGYRIWQSRMLSIAGVKGHSGSSWVTTRDQFNWERWELICLLLPNFVRTADQVIQHCRVKGHAEVIPGHEHREAILC